MFNYKKILLFIFLLSTTLSNAQTDEALSHLKTDIEDFINAYKESNYEKVVDYLPDFIFEDISKEKVMKVFSQGSKAEIPDINQIKIDTIITVKSTQYARIQMEVQHPTYAIKKETNLHWTFCDLNSASANHIPIEIRKTD